MPTAVSAALVLAFALLALSLLVAFRPRYRVALVTTVIVLLRYRAAGGLSAPPSTASSRSASGIVALAVALTITPMHAPTRRSAPQPTRVVADGGENRNDAWRNDLIARPVAVTRLHDRTRRANATAPEAARERRSYMSDTPDPEPPASTLEHQPRPRHQFPFAAHATARAGAQPAHRCNGGAGRGVRRDHTGARRGADGRRHMPATADDDAAFAAYAEAMGGLRREGLAATSATAMSSAFSPSSPALRKLERDPDELAARVSERAASRG